MSRSVSLDLQQKLQPSLKQMHRLMMTHQMQQALKILQLPVMELTAAIEEELEQNPLLEQVLDSDFDEGLDEEETDFPLEKSLSFDEKDFQMLQELDDHFPEAQGQEQDQEDKWRSYQETLIQSKPSLYEILMQQACQIFLKEEERKMAQALIGNFDERGFLQTSLEEIGLLEGFSVEHLGEILAIIQTFDPPGIGARDVRESFLLQLKAKNQENSLAYQIIQNHFQDLLKKQIPKVEKALKCSEGELKQALEQIAKLQMHPGNSCSTHLVPVAYPDVTLRVDNEELAVDIEDNFIPTLRLNRRYLRLLEDPELPDETKEFILKKIGSAKKLVKNIYQRNDTLKRIAASLAVHQRSYFLEPDGKLVPLTMKTLAEELQLHESTIARTVSNKYIDTPRGLLPLRSFFTAALSNDNGEEISSHSVREMIVDLIKNEDKKHPYSDDCLATLIQKRGIRCARRTVAKYRVILKIGNAHQRRQY